MHVMHLEQSTEQIKIIGLAVVIMSIFLLSLHPLKTITTGEGGVITTNSKNINKKIKEFRSLGIVKNKKNTGI